jgi:hypothetical protein
MLVVLIVNLAYGGRNNMKNNTNYKRRRDDVKISMIPRWMDITMIVCKWLIGIIPFLVCSLMYFFQSEMSLWDNLLLTSVYLLSLSNIINCLDN